MGANLPHLPHSTRNLITYLTGLRPTSRDLVRSGEHADLTNSDHSVYSRRVERQFPHKSVSVKSTMLSSIDAQEAQMTTTWERPSFVEIKMDAEIGSYQEDFDGPPDVREGQHLAIQGEPAQDE
jgi:hypothetical protein